MIVFSTSVVAVDTTAAASSSQAKRPFLGGFLRESRIVYPLKIGPRKAIDEHRYDEQEAGISVRYATAEDRKDWIDVYFYPAGILSEEEFAEVAEQDRDDLRKIRRQADKREPDIGELQRFLVMPASPDGTVEKKEGFSTALSFDGRNSAMTLVLDRLYFIKGRFTVPSGQLSSRKTRDTLEDFMVQLVPKVTISSNGECWMPLLIEKLTEGQPKPEGAAMSIAKDGKTTAFLRNERVFAVDPDAADAKAAMMFGMAMQGRLFPGCDGSDPINPEIPAGMREIRLEYRVPNIEPAPGQTIQPHGRKARA